MPVAAREERTVIHARLIKMQGHQLLQLSAMVGITLHNGMSRQESVDHILKAMGYPNPARQSSREAVAPTEAPVYTLEEIAFLLDKYVEDEIALLEASASMLRTLRDLRHDTKQYIKEVRAELGYQHGHTNLPRIVTLLRMLFPDAQL